MKANDDAVPGAGASFFDCVEKPWRIDDTPACTGLWHVITQPTDYIDYDFYVCQHCKRVWEESFFYQDWEPHWHILAFEQFKEKRDLWETETGKNLYPELAFAGGIEGFINWMVTMPSPMNPWSMG